MQLQPYEILVIRDSRNFISKNNFKYPELGYVEALDFADTDECGKGLHANPWGEGDVYFIGEGHPDQIFQVIKVDTRYNFVHGRVPLLDKCKFKGGQVILSTKILQEANNLIKRYNPKARCNHSIEYRNDTNEYYGGLHCTQRSRVHGSLQIAKAFSCQYAEGSATQVSDFYGLQKATYSALQIGGEHTTQHCTDSSIQVAGPNSMQSAYSGTYQKAEVGTLQICGSSTRVVTRESHNKWYGVNSYCWSEVIDRARIDELEGKVKYAKAKAEEKSWNDEWMNKRLERRQNSKRVLQETASTYGQ